MYPSKHVIFSIFFVIILLYLFPQISFLGLIIILASAVLIDIDHYLYYAFRKKDWNLMNALKWFNVTGKKFFSLSKTKREKTYDGFYFLHGLEILLIVYLLGFFVNNYFYFILIGFSFHLLLDYIDLIFNWERFERFSIIYDFLKFKKLKFIEDI